MPIRGFIFFLSSFRPCNHSTSPCLSLKSGQVTGGDDDALVRQCGSCGAGDRCLVGGRQWAQPTTLIWVST